MDDRSAEALERWAAALTGPGEAALADLREVLAADVVSVSPLGTAEGAEAVLANFGQSPIAPLFAQGAWSKPVEDTGAVVVSCTFRPGAPVGGVVIRASVDGGLLTRVETTISPSAPPEPTPVNLTGPIADAINGALANGTPVTVAYVDEEGQPHLSLRGTTQVLNDRQLALWARNPDGGLPGALADRPRVALMYRDPASRTSYQFQGVARVVADERLRNAIFDHSPEVERNFDPQRRGAAIVIDVTRAEGRDARGLFIMK